MIVEPDLASSDDVVARVGRGLTYAMLHRIHKGRTVGPKRGVLSRPGMRRGH